MNVINIRIHLSLCHFIKHFSIDNNLRDTSQETETLKFRITLTNQEIRMGFSIN